MTTKMEAIREVVWAYGCGDYRVLIAVVNRLMYEQGISVERLAKVSARMLDIPIHICEAELRKMVVN